MEKKEKSTLTYYKRWKATDKALQVGKFVLPLVPATIITGLNWNEWFAKTGGGVGLPFGFAMLLVSIVLSIYGYCKRDAIASQKISPFFFVSMVGAGFGISFSLLANIMDTMGTMLLCTVAGVLASGVADQTQRTIIKSRLAEYKQLVDDNQLDIKAQRKAERKAKAEAERKAKAESERKNNETQATE